MAKNLHLEHLEDEILNKGTAGAAAAIKSLEKLGKYLSKDNDSNLKITTKFDGAPAIICGTDPTDNRFFVGTKSVFNKTEPKICKSREDVYKFYSGELASKLETALQYLPRCNIKGVLQGDMMFTNDKTTKIIDGRSHTTFTPNTITYAAESNSPLGHQIQSAQIGIVFHTKYTGQTLDTMSASFNVDKRDFTENSSVWAQKAEFQNIGGAANFNNQEASKYQAIINKARGSLLASGNILNEIQSGKKALKIDTEMKIFFNRYVRTGTIPSVDKAYREFYFHMGKQYNKPIEKLKTLKSQANKAGQFMDAVDFMKSKEGNMRMLIATYLNIMAAKNMVVNKLNQIDSMKVFVRQSNGDMKATTPEGYVAVGTTGAIKLVDRLEFSKLNFTMPKSFGK